jgi:hypothetical protein
MSRFAALLLLCSACSLITVNGPPSVDPGFRPIRCTRDNIAPAFDGYVGGVTALTAGVLGLTYLAMPDETTSFDGMSEDSGKDVLVAPILITAALGGLLLYSGFDGFSKTKRCRNMNLAPPGLYRD